MDVKIKILYIYLNLPDTSSFYSSQGEQARVQVNTTNSKGDKSVKRKREDNHVVESDAELPFEEGNACDQSVFIVVIQ